jgi:hypothetical protein
MAAISPLKYEIFSLTVENQSIMFAIKSLGRPPTRKNPSIASKFVPSCLTCRLAAPRPTLGLRWRQAEAVCFVEYSV